MSSIASLPILVLVPSPSQTEREIDRRVLLDIAADREGLIMSGKSIEEIRQILKLRTGPIAGHWLHHVKHRSDVNLRDATARTSMLIRRVNNENKGEESGGVVRRVLSVSSLSQTPMASIQNRMVVGQDDGGLSVWGTFVLSTPNKLISPRPLGPTHILVVHTDPVAVSRSGKTTLPRRRPNADGGKAPFANIDIAINDLLFTLNVPNLVSLDGRSALPKRLHKELPRALIRVPHMETFHELVVYLHTKNQAELFRSVVPEWMRDLMHPLPAPEPTVTPRPSHLEPGTVVFSPKKQRSHRTLFGMLSSSTSSASSMYSVDSSLSSGSASIYESSSTAPERTLDSIAQEIIETLPTMVDPDVPSDPLMAVTAQLNALKTNLEFLGYFGQSVWDELEACREILIRAVVWKSKMAVEEEE
ncbi:hypothetical protein C8J57DRAFT_216751 [Mycena rebaudengoi]|nr:hypothetical protein C8J57DRAFT_216751 [Mycena rebaudengoi]